MATVTVGAPSAPPAPEARRGVSSWIAERGPAQYFAAIGAVLVVWIALFSVLRGHNTRALGPAETKPLHVWLSDLQTRVGEGRNTNPLFTYFFNPIRSVIDARLGRPVRVSWVASYRRRSLARCASVASANDTSTAEPP